MERKDNRGVKKLLS